MAPRRLYSQKGTRETVALLGTAVLLVAGEGSSCFVINGRTKRAKIGVIRTMSITWTTSLIRLTSVLLVEFVRIHERSFPIPSPTQCRCFLGPGPIHSSQLLRFAHGVPVAPRSGMRSLPIRIPYGRARTACDSDSHSATRRLLFNTIGFGHLRGSTVTMVRPGLDLGVFS